MHIVGVPEERKEEIYETIMNKNFPKLMSDNKSQTQEAQRTVSRKKKCKQTNKKHLGKSFSKYKKSKIKKKSCKKPETNKHLTYNGIKIRIISDVSLETMKTKRE